MDTLKQRWVGREGGRGQLLYRRKGEGSIQNVLRGAAIKPTF